MCKKQTICIIGNYASNSNISDGGRIKIRFIKNALENEGFDVNVVDLNNWSIRFLKIIFQIKKSIKNNDRIIVMGGPKGCRVIIPLVVKYNKNYNSKLVFCPVGIGTLDVVVKKLSNNQLLSFLNSKNFYNLNDNKMGEYLSKFEYVLPENNILVNCYRKFYNLNNVYELENLRFDTNDIALESKNNSKDFQLIYLSRVTENKGIYDLIYAVNEVNKTEKNKINLDIFGEIQLSNKNYFNENHFEHISYKGVINNIDSYKTLAKYDMFALPTKYYAEGTSGSLVESLIVGTPVLVSSYSQVNELIIDKHNGLIFELNNKDSLIQTLRYAVNNKNSINLMRKKARESSKKFLYEFNKDNFLKYITGDLI